MRSQEMAERQFSDIDRRAGLLLLTLAVMLWCVWLVALSSPAEARVLEPAQKGRRQRPAKKPALPPVNYSNFSHRTHVEKQKLACNSCHKVPSKNWKEVRKGDAAFPDVTDF